MRPSEIITLHRQTICDTAARFPVANIRIFGSTAQGTDTDSSDLDLLIDPLPHTTLFDLGGLQDELETRLGIRVDIRTPQDLPASFRQQVLSEAKAL
ncbi:nucleotidyltransferase family protein [Neisseria sp. ZJ106]|uniref:Nucleotidyltransferase family protein n=1 Tax=Neisseria lisongii TaxID=2912188 RepID=A0AAW5AL21_9NEIS|nr:nucleotidyltransferase family protein [Neisseria lisongii]MCF7522090.1 nucleotidyltransferase family protein [Neisseria lisongii]MCF7530557.1 nucleotidyltransferase family protein [Neisseria lisongii]WCL71376.1 nucleotidyltransferase family protein [Neisseria lisongii]